MKNKFDYCVYIGRFQPFHEGHLHVLQKALEYANEVIIVIGSDQSCRNIKNPWTSQEREAMILGSIDYELQSRIHFRRVRDWLYNENMWITAVQQAVCSITRNSKSVAITGHQKDESSYYISSFPEWKFIPANPKLLLHATEVRNQYFGNYQKDKWCEHLSMYTQVSLREFSRMEPFEPLKEEYDYIQKYKASWSKAPFPPTFITVDSVVIKSGHVLMVKRGQNPGRGLYALPGGFLNGNERLLNTAIRETQEETGIEVSVEYLAGKEVFDHPDRSLRGRTVTHAFCFKLPDGPLPSPKAGDDAAESEWIPMYQLFNYPDELMEDHFHILTHFIQKV